MLEDKLIHIKIFMSLDKDWFELGSTELEGLGALHW